MPSLICPLWAPPGTLNARHGEETACDVVLASCLHHRPPSNADSSREHRPPPGRLRWCLQWQHHLQAGAASLPFPVAYAQPNAPSRRYIRPASRTGQCRERNGWFYWSWRHPAAYTRQRRDTTAWPVGFPHVRVLLRAVLHGEPLTRFRLPTAYHVQAFLLNRVQNVVVPPRHSTSYHRQLQSLERRFGRRSWTRLLRSCLPVNLTSTRSRLILRIPSIYLLLKSLTLWSIILLQAAHMLPSSSGWLKNNLEHWASHKTMEEVCWSTFISVCTALFVAALTTGMEGFHVTGNAPFNLVRSSFPGASGTKSHDLPPSSDTPSFSTCMRLP